MTRRHTGAKANVTLHKYIANKLNYTTPALGACYT